MKKYKLIIIAAIVILYASIFFKIMHYADSIIRDFIMLGSYLVIFLSILIFNYKRTKKGSFIQKIFLIKFFILSVSAISFILFSFSTENHILTIGSIKTFSIYINFVFLLNLVYFIIKATHLKAKLK